MAGAAADFARTGFAFCPLLAQTAPEELRDVSRAVAGLGARNLAPRGGLVAVMQDRSFGRARLRARAH